MTTENVATSTTAPAQDSIRSYTKQSKAVGRLTVLTYCIAFFVFGVLKGSQRSASLAETLTSNFYLQLALSWSLVWLLCAIAQLPPSLYRFRLDRKFKVSKLGLSQWLRDFLKSNILALAFGVAIVEISFACGVLFPSYGWFLAGILLSLLFMAFSRSLPWVLSFFYPVVPITDKNLQERITLLAAKARLRIGVLYEWRISERTRRANALVTGMGSVRRILLTDTLISELSEDEMDAIVAHELGHCALHHVRARLLLRSFVFVLSMYVIDLAVRYQVVVLADRNPTWSDLTLVPGFFLYWGCTYVYGNILVAALSRKQERAADIYSWTLIGRAAPFITAMRKLTNLNLIDFDKKSEWKHMHPSTAGRIAAAEQFAKARGEVI
jgi:STE24 endopeptidase